jgi:hypothetical protein
MSDEKPMGQVIQIDEARQNSHAGRAACRDDRRASKANSPLRWPFGTIEKCNTDRTPTPSISLKKSADLEF